MKKNSTNNFNNQNNIYNGSQLDNNVDQKQILTDYNFADAIGENQVNRVNQVNLINQLNQINKQPVNIRHNKKKKNKKNLKLTILMVLGVILILFLLFLILKLYVFSKLRTVESTNRPQQTVLKNNNQIDSEDEPDLPPPYSEDLVNILLIGIDNRDDDNINTNSDTMMIVTLDQKNGVIKLSSIQRDMIVKIPNRTGFYKINSAMFGGPENLLRTVNYNLKLDINKYIVVNLHGAERIIDLMDGVNVDIPDNQPTIDYLNSVIWDTNKELGGEWSPPIENPGLQLLNGRQAICFSRLRKLDSDFVRMSRQHEVLKALFRRFLDINPLKKLSVIRESLGLMTSNLTANELLSLGTSAMTKVSKPIETIKIPFDEFLQERYINGISYIVPNLQAMIEPVHMFIYGEVHDDKSVIDEYRNNIPAGTTGGTDTGATFENNDPFGKDPTNDESDDGNSSGLSYEDLMKKNLGQDKDAVGENELP